MPINQYKKIVRSVHGALSVAHINSIADMQNEMFIIEDSVAKTKSGDIVFVKDIGQYFCEVFFLDSDNVSDPYKISTYDIEFEPWKIGINITRKDIVLFNSNGCINSESVSFSPLTDNIGEDYEEVDSINGERNFEFWSIGKIDPHRGFVTIRHLDFDGSSNYYHIEPDEIDQFLNLSVENIAPIESKKKKSPFRLLKIRRKSENHT